MGFNNSANSVCVWVCGNYNICVNLFRKLYGKVKAVFKFGIWEINRREISVGFFLFRNNINVFKANFLKYSSYRLISRTMKRRVNNFKVISHFSYYVAVKRKFLYCGNVCVIKLWAKFNIISAFFCLFKAYFFNFRYVYGVYFLHYFAVTRRRNLSAVFPVYFVTVIFCRVMACRNNYACRTAQMSYCKRKNRNRTKFGINICLYFAVFLAR